MIREGIVKTGGINVEAHAGHFLSFSLAAERSRPRANLRQPRDLRGETTRALTSRVASCTANVNTYLLRWYGGAFVYTRLPLTPRANAFQQFTQKTLPTLAERMALLVERPVCNALLPAHTADHRRIAPQKSVRGVDLRMLRA